MRSERVKKGDLVIELRNRDGSYRLHSQKGVVAEPVMDRINERIARLTPWIIRIGDENWPLPEPPKDFASEEEQAEILDAVDAAYANIAASRSSSATSPETTPEGR